MLFGSQARGDARPDSDYDIAVFLRSMDGRWAEHDRMATLHVQFLDSDGVFFDAKPFLATEYEGRTLPLHESRREDVGL